MAGSSGVGFWGAGGAGRAPVDDKDVVVLGGADGLALIKHVRRQRKTARSNGAFIPAARQQGSGAACTTGPHQTSVLVDTLRADFHVAVPTRLFVPSTRAE